MIEEGLYDNEPQYVRATIYERILGEVPFSGLDIHDALIDKDKLFKWIKNHGFELFHSKLADYSEDGEERTSRFYVNREKKQMITLRRCFIDPVKDIDILSSDNSPVENKNKTNPNKIDWFSFYAPSEADVMAFKKTFDGFRIKEDPKNKLYMLKAMEYGGLELDSFPTSCDNTSLELNYGSAFTKTHEKVIDSLMNKKSGLYVFHGPPGTGKTSYIKYLTTIVEDRKFIFVPNTMVAELFSPKLVDKLYSFKNSVLVLEDAEVCVFKRDGNNNALVAGILNITDGLLKDLLNIAIVVTFNSADVQELDVALLRKGRLKIMHKFDVLSEDDAKKLATHLEKKKPVTKPLSLADIYNLDEETGLEESDVKKTVGFGAS
jgi:hypothetical protein